MNGFKNKIRRIKFKLSHDFFSMENIVLIVAFFLCLVWTFQSISAMTKNWELSERLTSERRALELLKIEVEMAELENDYYYSEEYQELLARKQLDKKMPGENMIVMPENSENAINKYREPTVKVAQRDYSNFEKWMKFLFPSY